ncbi:MAG: hypothetical protein ACOCV8_02260 [Spirochaetota bacterium]
MLLLDSDRLLSTENVIDKKTNQVIKHIQNHYNDTDNDNKINMVVTKINFNSFIPTVKSDTNISFYQRKGDFIEIISPYIDNEGNHIDSIIYYYSLEKLNNIVLEIILTALLYGAVILLINFVILWILSGEIYNLLYKSPSFFSKK